MVEIGELNDDFDLIRFGRKIDSVMRGFGFGRFRRITHDADRFIFLSAYEQALEYMALYALSP